MRRIRALWIAIVALLVVLGGLALAYYGFMAYVRRAMSSPAAARMARSDPRVRAAEAAIQAELQRIRAAGQPVTAREIAPPPVPDAENAALLYQKAFDAPRLPVKDVDALDSLIRNAPGPERDRSVVPVRAVLARNKGVLELAYQAARRPRCRFPVKWEDGAAALFPHPSRLRDLSRLVAAQAVLCSLDGEAREALQWVWVGIAMGDALADEPAQLSQVYRYRLYAGALDALQASLGAGRVPSDLGKPIYDHLASVQIMGPLKRGLIGDRAGAVTTYQVAQSKPEYLGIKLNGAQKTILPPVWTVDAAEWLPLMGERIALVDEPYRAAKAQLAPLDARAQKLAKDAGDADPVVAMVIFSSVGGWATHLWQERDICQARIGLAEAALALKAYQAQHGAYPDSLKTLRSAVGWKIPQDPFSGRDFVYKRQGAGAVIYSIGPNLRDDRGVPLRLRSVQSREYLGDIVWRLP